MGRVGGSPLANIRTQIAVLLPFGMALLNATPAFATEADPLSGNQLPGATPSATLDTRQPEADRVIETATMYVQLGAYHMAYQQLFATDPKTFHDERITAMLQRLEADPRLSKTTMSEIRRQAEARWALHGD